MNLAHPSQIVAKRFLIPAPLRAARWGSVGNRDLREEEAVPLVGSMNAAHPPRTAAKRLCIDAPLQVVQ